MFGKRYKFFEGYLQGKKEHQFRASKDFYFQFPFGHTFVQSDVIKLHVPLTPTYPLSVCSKRYVQIPMTGQTYNFIKTEIEIIIAELFLKKYEFTLTS